MLRSAGSKCVVTCAWAIALVMVALNPAAADQRVRGHFRSNGTYVAPYMRSEADGRFENNFSTKGNINPYNWKPGTRVNPRNQDAPSYFASSRYQNLPASPHRAVVNTPYYGSATIPSVDDSRVAEIAALAKAYSDAKAQALSTARASSDQRRKAFVRKVEAESLKSAADFDALKAAIVAAHAQREPTAVERDKAELRTRHRELIDQFDRGQAAKHQQFTTTVASKRERLANYYNDRQSLAADLERGRMRAKGEPTVASLLRDEQQENEQKLESNIACWTDKHAKAAAAERTKHVARTIAFVRGELATRIDRRRAELDQRLLALKTTHHQDVGQRIAKLESEFERAEVERLAADQERAERRFLTYVHGRPIDSAFEAKPVAYSRPASSTQPVDGSALTITVAVGLVVLLALGAILSSRSKSTDFRPSVKLPAGK